MVSSCCVVNCKNRRVKTSSINLRFYRIPKYDKERRAKWLKAIGREGWQQHLGSFTRVCSDHFVYGEKSDNKLSPNYVPCIFSHTTSIEKRRLQKLYDDHNKELVERVNKIAIATLLLPHAEEVLKADASENVQADLFQKKRAKERDIFEEQECLFEYVPDIKELLGDHSNLESTPRKSQDTQTLLVDSYLKSLEDEYYKLKSELSLVKEKDLFRDMQLDMFKNNDHKVRCLTGLSSYDMLKVLCDYISVFQGDHGKLSKFQQLMITLIKIKLNLPMPFLAILFNISLTTVSRSFRFTIDLLCKRIVPLLVFWPTRDDMRMLIPSYFEDCENCLYSVDYFELDVEVRGSSHLGKEPKEDALDVYLSGHLPDIRKRKFFLSVAPQGSVIFISQGSGGDTSERVLAVDSGFFENVSPNDVIVAETDLEIESDIDNKGATLELAVDYRNGNNITLVNVRNVVHTMKKRYQIMGDTILRNWVRDFDKDGLCTCDKIVQVVCALFNMTNKDWNYRECLALSSLGLEN